MLRRLFVGMVILVLFASQAYAFDLYGNCSIRFFGNSTLHGFEGTGSCEPFNLTSTEGSGAQTIHQSQIEVKVAGLDTDNSARDKKMRKMFDVERYPLISGRLTDFDPDALLLAWQNAPEGNLTFELLIREIRQPVNAKVHDLTITEDRITFTMEFTLSLKSFQLKPPSVLGIIRVADPIRVEIDVDLAKRKSSAAVLSE